MISIIIPTYNESDHIRKTIEALFKNAEAAQISEIIVVDGGSTDLTIPEATAAGGRIIQSARKGRAVQMNYAAKQANSSILYFLHADTIPPPGFADDIRQAVQAGFASGCFTLSFDYHHWFLKANCWFTRFNSNYFRFGDQSLFVTKEAFLRIGGFQEKHTIMEDQEIIRRLRNQVKFKIIKKPVITSARKYLSNGIYKTQGIFFLIYAMYYLGFSQNKLVKTYRNLIRQEKI